MRYEDLTAAPEQEVRRICEFLGVDWEPAMLDYGQFDHGRLTRGLGDWRAKIKTGAVQAGRDLPEADEIPASCVASAAPGATSVPAPEIRTIIPTPRRALTALSSSPGRQVQLSSSALPAHA